MLSISEGRSLLRTIAVGGVLVGTLATASSASAALGGAPAASFSNRPNLQSVTFSGIVASFKFDRSLQSTTTPNPQLFKVGGYRAGVTSTEATTANISSSDPTVVLVTFPSSNNFNGVDFNANTFGAVGANAVNGVGTFNNPNFADAAPITGATGESGTRGHTTGPDLVSAAVDQNQNRITFTFDQRVQSDPFPDASNFRIIGSNGTTANGTSIVNVSGSDVTVQFAGPPTLTVDAAVQAFVIGGSGAGTPRASGQPSSFGAPFESVTVAGRQPLTLNPTLVSAEIDGAGTIVFTFDQPIGSATAGNFTAVASNGQTVPGTGASVNGNAVRVTFSTSDFIEHIVYGSADAGAATATNGARPSIQGGKPAGGNAGAKASGFTTAPDAVASTINANGQVSVLFDSRIAFAIAINNANFQLLTSDGTNILPSAVGTATVQQSSGTPSQSRVVLQFTPQQVAVATALRVVGNKVVSTGAATATFDTSDPSVIGTIPTSGGVFGAGGGGGTTFGGPDARNVETILKPSTVTTSFAKKK